MLKKLTTLLVLLFTLATPVAALAQTIRQAYTSEALTVLDDAVKVFTAAKVRASNTNVANQTTVTVYCSSGTACILRYTIDGTTPSATVGHRAFYGDTFSILGYTNNANFKAIAETADHAVIYVTYYR